MTKPTLAECVARLSETHQEQVRQVNQHGVTCLTLVTRPPLLIQLRDAVYSSTGRRGASSLGSERIPINAGALELYARIRNQVNDSYEALTGDVAPPDLEHTLWLWHKAFLNAIRDGEVDQESVDRATARAQQWVEQIEGMFDPPKVLELMVERVEIVEAFVDTRSYFDVAPRLQRVQREERRTLPAPCPKCTARYAEDPATGNRVLAVVVEYHEGGDLFGTLRAVCRACNHEWRGAEAGRPLQALIQETDHRLQQRDTAA